MLKLEGVRAGYGAIEVLKGIDLHVDEGEIVTLIGANGAGKTTTLMTICGLVRPRAGKVVFRGIDRGLDWVRDRYRSSLRFLLARPLLVMIAFLVCVGGTYKLIRDTPTGFIPDEDQGYIIISVQGPDGMSVTDTQKVMRKIEKILKTYPEVNHMFMISGFSLGGSGPNRER